MHHAKRPMNHFTKRVNAPRPGSAPNPQVGDREGTRHFSREEEWARKGQQALVLENLGTALCSFKNTRTMSLYFDRWYGHRKFLHSRGDIGAVTHLDLTISDFNISMHSAVKLAADTDDAATIDYTASMRELFSWVIKKMPKLKSLTIAYNAYLLPGAIDLLALLNKFQYLAALENLSLKVIITEHPCSYFTNVLVNCAKVYLRAGTPLHERYHHLVVNYAGRAYFQFPGIDLCNALDDHYTYKKKLAYVPRFDTITYRFSPERVSDGNPTLRLTCDAIDPLFTAYSDLKMLPDITGELCLEQCVIDHFGELVRTFNLPKRLVLRSVGSWIEFAVPTCVTSYETFYALHRMTALHVEAFFPPIRSPNLPKRYNKPNHFQVCTSKHVRRNLSLKPIFEQDASLEPSYKHAPIYEPFLNYLDRKKVEFIRFSIIVQDLEELDAIVSEFNEAFDGGKALPKYQEEFEKLEHMHFEVVVEGNVYILYSYQVLTRPRQ